MPEAFTFVDLTLGQNDTHGVEGLELAQLRRVFNTRYTNGYPQRRPGMVRIAVAGTDATALDLTAGSSHHVSIPAHSVHAMTPPFSMEGLIEPDSVTGTQIIVGFGHAGNFPFEIRLNAAALEVDLLGVGAGTVSLSAAAVAAIGVKLYFRVTVDGDGNSSLYVDGATTADATDAASLVGDTLVAAGGAMYLGRDNGGSYYDGSICYFRAVRYVIPDSSMAFTRWPTPREPYMLWNYGGDVDAQNIVLDTSPFENHGIAVNTPGTTTALCVNPAPIQGMKVQRDKNNVTRLPLVAGGRVYRAVI